MANTPGHSASVPSVRINAHSGNLVYGFHPYACSVPVAACNTTAQARAPLALLSSWSELAKTAPILVTEFGWPVHPTNDGTNYVDGSRYYAETIAFLEAQTPVRSPSTAAPSAASACSTAPRPTRPTAPARSCSTP